MQLSERLQSAAPMRLPSNLEEMELEAVLRGSKVVELINVPHRARDLLHEFLVNGPVRPASGRLCNKGCCLEWFECGTSRRPWHLWDCGVSRMAC